MTSHLDPRVTTFAYTRPQRGFGDEDTVEIFENHAYPPRDAQGLSPTIGIHDMNGDGLPDLIRADSQGWVVRLGTGSRDPQVGLFGEETPCSWPCGTNLPCELLSEITVDGDWTYATSLLLDLDGDGLPDIVSTAPWSWHRNNGSCVEPPFPGDCFDPAASWPAPNPVGDWHTGHGAASMRMATGVGAEDLNVTHRWATVADANGDGLPDRLVSGPGEKVYASINNGSGFDAFTSVSDPNWSLGREPDDYVNQAGGTALNPLGRLYDAMWNIPLATRTHRLDKLLVDLNGDGYPDHVPGDLCILGSAIGFGLGDGWQHPSGAGHRWRDPNRAGCFGGPDVKQPGPGGPTQALKTPDVSVSAIGLFSGSGTQTALIDINGDGILDLYDDAGWPISVYYGLGDGRFLAKALNCSSDCAPEGFDWPSLWPIRFSGALPTETIDVDGDRLPDSIFSVTAGSGDQWWVQFHPGPEGLLEGITNELGGTATIQYEPAARHASAQAESGLYPNYADLTEALSTSVRRHTTRAWVAVSLANDDGRSTFVQTETLRYAEARFDFARRESLGFRMVERTDATAVATRTLHHQVTPLLGRTQLEEVVAPDGTLLRSREVEWITTVQPGGLHWFTRRSREENILYAFEPGGSGTAHEVATVVEWDHDEYGNPSRIHDWGSDADADTDDDYVIEMFYAPELGNWLLAYPWAIVQQFGTDMAPGGEKPAGTQFLQYDSEGLGVPPTRGLVTKSLRKQNVGASPWLEEQWDHDPFGNATSYWSPRALAEGFTTLVIGYEHLNLNTFPTTLTNAMQHVRQLAYARGTGTLESASDENGYLRCLRYDGFGQPKQLEDDSDASGQPGHGECDRLIATWVADDLGSPTTQRVVTTYHPGDTPFKRIDYFDGFGRTYQEAVQAGGVNYGAYTLPAPDFFTVSREWDSRGLLACETLSRFSDGGALGPCTTLPPPRRDYTWDELRRPESRSLVGVSATTIEQEWGYWSDDANANVQWAGVTLTGTPDRPVSYSLDARGRVIAAIEYDTFTQEAFTTQFSWDPKGRMTAVSSPPVELASGLSAHYGLWVDYNFLDQRSAMHQVSTQHPEILTWTYHRDLNGNLKEEIDPRGVAIRYWYDPLDRPKFKDYAPFADPQDPQPDPLDTVLGYDAGSNGTALCANVA